MPLLPWENLRAAIAGEDLERLVVDLLKEAGGSLTNFRIEHQERVIASDGAYRIDVTGAVQGG